MNRVRPTPEKLLKKAQAEESLERRGKLKIYLGAAPGVGKTYTMLNDALAKREQGLDVVIGLVEAHDRQKVVSFLKQFEILPRQTVEYRGKQLFEFDLDAALKRNPGLVLIDEMAHTNAPGLRHTKRWQDIKEILDRGTDVYTTLNVQHIESLNDIVSKITHIRVVETVPDSMLELADTIELVDLPPEDLLKRLQEGKVYLPEQAELAKERFFRKGNLIALRELALRVTAERVGAQVLLYRQDQGIKHIWPTQEKILVCVGPGAKSIKLIRAARRMATSLQVDWIAVHVEAPRLRLSASQRVSAIQNLRLAEQLGAETRILSGFDLVTEIIGFAREQNVTQIMIWKTIRPRWKEFLFNSLADEIVRHSEEIDVYIMTGEADDFKVSKPVRVKRKLAWRTYQIAIGIVTAVTIIDFLLYSALSASNLIMVYLLGVTVVALFGRVGPSILISILSVLTYDFFFLPPFFSFSVSDIQSVVTLGVMLLVALTISNLTILTRRQVQIARFTERHTAAMYTLSRQLARTRGVENLLDITTQYISTVFDSEVLALIPEDGALVIKASSKDEWFLNEKDQSVAQWVYDLKQAAGLGTNTLPFTDALYLPLLTSKDCLGVLRVKPSHKQLFSPEQRNLLETSAHQVALAIEVDQSHGR